MHYDGHIIRPPSEAESILLQITTGCSHNKCTFCGIYKDKKFTIKNDNTINADLLFAQKHFKHICKLFLCDGDALIVPYEKLCRLLDSIHEYLPWVTRISTYANAKSISLLSTEQLMELKSKNLKLLHLGLESGDDETLLFCNKWGDSKRIIQECQKAKAAGIQLFITVLLGLAGKERSLIHGEKTGDALTQINPNFVGALSYMPVENTELYSLIQKGSFTLLEPMDLLTELKVMLEHTTMEQGYFYSNHASNYLPLRIRMPRDKAEAIKQIENALGGEILLKPEWMRGL
jgi:radical SAM superfamily enzyme YgiQ (UPF0313 family)